MRKHLILIAIGMVLFGCKNSNEPISVPNFFTDADLRIYSHYSFDSDGKQTYAFTDTVTIIASSNFDGLKQITFSDGTRATLSGSDSTWILSEFNPNTSFCSLSKFPAKAGDTLLKVRNIPVQIGDVIGPANVTTLVSENGKRVTVPLGVYDCSVYEFTMSMSYLPAKSKVITYVSPLIGVVKREYYSTSADHQLYLTTKDELIGKE